MKTFTLGQRVRYAFDNTLSRGTPALIAWLAIVTVAFLAFASILLMIFGAAPRDESGAALSFPALVWHNLMRTLDAGTMGGDSGSLLYLLMMLFVTLGGVFIVGTLIGLISNGVGNQIEELRKGRSLVAETDHVVILGWNDRIFTIIGELIIGNEHRKRHVIVIMADRDKVSMDDEVRERLRDAKSATVVCRRGNPIDLADLRLVNFNAARAIIVLSPEGDDPDAEVIKSILAVTNHPDRRPERFHIVAEIRERQNMEPARLVGRDEAQLIQTGETIARVIAQTCRQTGLSGVYTEMLDFGGDEIYFKRDAALDDLSFADALFAFDTSSLIGVKTAGGTVQLNPPMDRIFAAGDEAIVVAADMASVRVARHTPVIDATLLKAKASSVPVPERTLLLGWSSRAPIIIRELDNYVAAGSLVTVIADGPSVANDIETLKGVLVRQQLDFRRGNSSDRAMLESVDPEQYEHIIVLCYADDLPAQKADAKTLVTLLHLRDIESRSGANRYSIVSEMLDVRNRELAEITQADDFIVSENLTSLLVAQVTENRDLRAVFEDIFASEGSEIYLRPASDYVVLGAPMSYWHVVEVSRSRGEVAIGYRQAGGKDDGVRVNPPKDSSITFAADDRIIVLAEN